MGPGALDFDGVVEFRGRADVEVVVDADVVDGGSGIDVVDVVVDGTVVVDGSGSVGSVVGSGGAVEGAVGAVSVVVSLVAAVLVLVVVGSETDSADAGPADRPAKARVSPTTAVVTTTRRSWSCR